MQGEAAAHVRAVAAKVAEEVGLGAAGFLKGIGQDGQAIDVVDSWLEGTERGKQRAKEIWRVIRPDPNRTLNQRTNQLPQAYNRRAGLPDDPNIKAWAALGYRFGDLVHALTH